VKKRWKTSGNRAKSGDGMLVEVVAILSIFCLNSLSNNGGDGKINSQMEMEMER